MRWQGFMLLFVVSIQSTLAGSWAPDAEIECSSCKQWNAPQAPYRIHGDTYYVGVAGLSSVLIASRHGHILLDGALPQSAKLIEQHIRQLGFRLEDVRYIVNSHTHYDHAGGIAALQRASGAMIKASPASVSSLQSGELPSDDPQYGLGKKETSFPAVKTTTPITDGEILSIGDTVITAHFTPGHTPGGTTWTWQSCEQDKCLSIVYADSLNAVSSDDYRFSEHPKVITALRNSILRVANLPCDILIPVHPEFADLKAKHARIKADTKENVFVDNQACRKYAASANERLNARLANEKKR